MGEKQVTFLLQIKTITGKKKKKKWNAQPVPFVEFDSVALGSMESLKVGTNIKNWTRISENHRSK